MKEEIVELHLNIGWFETVTKKDEWNTEVFLVPRRLNIITDRFLVKDREIRRLEAYLTP